MNFEKHLRTRVPLTIEDIRWLWTDAPDNARIEMMKSIIWTAADQHEFYAKSMKLLDSVNFRMTLD